MSSNDFLDEENTPPENDSNIGDFSGSYQVYLLRLWQSGRGGVKTWRASLEESGSGMRHGFGSLNELYKFIEEQARRISRNPSGGRAK